MKITTFYHSASTSVSDGGSVANDVSLSSSLGYNENVSDNILSNVHILNYVIDISVLNVSESDLNISDSKGIEKNKWSKELKVKAHEK